MIIAIFLFVLTIIFLEIKRHTYLIENGNIVFKNLNDRYNLNSLIKDLIKNKVDDISKIEKAYLLFGNLRVISNKPYVLIANGKIDFESLLKSKKSLTFINEMLKEKSLKINQVLYAIYLNDMFYIVKM